MRKPLFLVLIAAMATPIAAAPAAAQGWQARQDWREYRQDRREANRDWRQDRRDDNRDFRRDQRQDWRAYQRGDLSYGQYRRERRGDVRDYRRNIAAMCAPIIARRARTGATIAAIAAGDRSFRPRDGAVLPRGHFQVIDLTSTLVQP